MANHVYKKFTSDASVTIPAGIKKIRLVVEKRYGQVYGMPILNSAGQGAMPTNAWLDPLGHAWGSGNNVFGQLGNGGVTPSSTPVAVLGGQVFNFLLSEGSLFSNGAVWALTPQGVPYSWGNNTNGQLGVGDVTSRSSAVALAGNLTFVYLAQTGANSVFGITPAGQVYGWGFNLSGHLGVGDVTPRSTPTATVGTSGIVFRKVIGTFGTGNTYFITTENKLYACGGNSLFSLGVGDNIPRSSPVAVLGNINFVDVAAAGLWCIGLDTNGAAWAWGQNGSGQHGTGNLIVQSSPVAVAGGLTFQTIVINGPSQSVYGLTPAGQVYSWGGNSQGQLGTGDTVNRSTPTAVIGLSGIVIKQIVVGTVNPHVAFIANDGTAYTCGSNVFSALGVGDLVARSSPVAVLGGFKFLSLWGYPSPMGVCDDGVVRAWGQNDQGQLGLGDQVNRSSPVAVIGAHAMIPFVQRDEKVISVVPGQTYNLKLNRFYAMFGTEIISLKGFVDSVTLVYEQ